MRISGAEPNDSMVSVDTITIRDDGHGGAEVTYSAHSAQNPGAPAARFKATSMSARFTTNFLILLLGAGLAMVTFAFSHVTAGWVALGVGSAGILVAAHNFALPHQGAYQRTADVVIAAVSAWAIVAAQVMSYGGRWLETAAGLGLSALGAIGLVVREAHLSRLLHIDPLQIELARLVHSTDMSGARHSSAARGGTEARP